MMTSHTEISSPPSDPAKQSCGCLCIVTEFGNSHRDVRENHHIIITCIVAIRFVISIVMVTSAQCIIGYRLCIVQLLLEELSLQIYSSRSDAYVLHYLCVGNVITVCMTFLSIFSIHVIMCTTYMPACLPAWYIYEASVKYTNIVTTD